MSAYDKFLAEIRVMQASLDRLADLLTLIAPAVNEQWCDDAATAEVGRILRQHIPPLRAPSPVTEWSCGHGHATRDEAAACLQEQRRAAAAHHPV